MHICLSLLATVLCTVFLQRMALQQPFKHRFFADAFAAMIGSYSWLFWLLCTKRPWLSFFCALLPLAFLTVVTRAKQRALRNEPLLFSDVNLLWQVIRFPWLYLPFLPWRAMLCALLPLVLLFWLLWQTPSVVLPTAFALFFLPLFLPLLCFVFQPVRAFFLRILKTFELKLEVSDAALVGPLAAAFLQSLWHYALRDGKKGITGPPEHPFAPTSFGNDLLVVLAKAREQLADLILIQEESFCDPRAFTDKLPPDYFADYDRLAHEGYAAELCVHAYGAYTMRTEYEVLTGIEPSFLGTDAFYPYWRVRNCPSWSIAQLLRSLGYRTVCVHPFAPGFFYRDRALPNLGFDAFFSINEFSSAERKGPYVSDMSVAHTISDLLRQSEKPLFCFAITMENHGPWTSGRLALEETSSYTALGFSPSVATYLAHLAHASDMLGFLSHALQNRKRAGLLAVYGDHLPGLPELVPENAWKTPCLLWKKDGLVPLGAETLSPASLTSLLLTGLLP